MLDTEKAFGPTLRSYGEHIEVLFRAEHSANMIGNIASTEANDDAEIAHQAEVVSIALNKLSTLLRARRKAEGRL